MEGVDYTSRRHIGYHKNSKSQLMSQERSSSCPRYTSPYYINYKVKDKDKEKGSNKEDMLKKKEKGDVINHITDVINHLHDFNTSHDYANVNNGFIQNNDQRSVELIKENHRLRNENNKLKKVLTSSKESNIYNNIDANNDSDYNKQYDSYNYESNVLMPLVLENKNLKKELSSLRLKEIQDSQQSNKTKMSNKDKDNRLLYGNSLVTLSNNVLKEIKAFNVIYNEITSNNISNYSNSNSENENEIMPKPKAKERGHCKPNEKSNRKLKPGPKPNQKQEEKSTREDMNLLYFEENSNITNVSDEESKRKPGAIVITEKYDSNSTYKQIKEKEHHFAIPLDQFVKNSVKAMSNKSNSKITNPKVNTLNSNAKMKTNIALNPNNNNPNSFISNNIKQRKTKRYNANAVLMKKSNQFKQNNQRRYINYP